MQQRSGNNPATHIEYDFFQRPTSWALSENSLHWHMGNNEVQLSLADITSLRINFHGHGEKQFWLCALEDSAGNRYTIRNRHWGRAYRIFPAKKTNTASFLALVFPLAKRLKSLNPNAIICEGPSRFEWLISCATAATAIAMAISAAGLMVHQGTVHYPVITFTALSLLYLPMLWPVIKSRGPTPLDPDALKNPE